MKNAGNEIFAYWIMKVRIQGNSLRFRLKQPEVAALKENDQITEEICFGEAPAESLRFVLACGNGPAFSIHYMPGNFTAMVPREVMRHWTESEQTGIEEDVMLPSGRNIHLLIEKDFKCLNGTDKENSGTFPNPMEAC